MSLAEKICDSIQLSIEGKIIGSVGGIMPIDTKTFLCRRFMLSERSIAEMFTKQDIFSIIIAAQSLIDEGFPIQKDNFRIIDHSFIYVNASGISMADEVKIENINGTTFDSDRYIRYLESKFSW